MKDQNNWPEGRMDIIGQNGPTGEHYEAVEELELLRRERDSLAAKLATHEQDEAIAKDIAKALQTALARNITDRLPLELAPKTDDLPTALTALTRLKTGRNNAMVELDMLANQLTAVCKERDQLAAHCERLREAIHDARFLLENPSTQAHENRVLEHLVSVMDATPAQSLAAIKAQAVRDWAEKYEQKFTATGVAVRDAMDYANQLEAGE